MSGVEAVVGAITAVVALLSAAVTSPCWAPLFSTDAATRTIELLKEKKEKLRFLINDLKPKRNGVLVKEVSDLITKSEAFLDGLKIQELEQRIEKKCLCGFLPHLCVQRQALYGMDGQLIPGLKGLIEDAESIISKGNFFRGYMQSGEVAINGRKRSETKGMIWGAVSSLNNPKLICIHGALGVGKTAMAKSVHNRALNDENEKLFLYVAWVDVEYGADVSKVQDSIAKSLDIVLDDGYTTVQRSNRLKTALLEMNNFLLVLDSMWKPMSLEDIGIPELEGRRKVIVTSRDSTLCDQMGRITVKFEVQPLASEEEAWELLQNEVTGIRLSLEGETKRALMAELDGLPLGIIKFALAMGNTHGEEINSNVSDKFGDKPFYLQGTDQELVKHFNHSLLDLDEKLRSCFMYCALFPKGHHINAKELIEYWMWEGLLGDSFKTLEVGVMAGKKTLQELQNKHLLQWASSDHEKVKMLSMFREMAIETMAKERRIVCIRSGCDLTNLPPRGQDWNSMVERASLMNNKLKALDLKGNKNFKQLLTLLLQDNPLDSNHLHKDNFFSSMCNLGVLDLSRTKITTLPKSMSNLKKLCALILRGCSNLKELPNLSKLQQLIVLDVSHSPLEQCPQGINKLKRLRRLNLSQTKLTSFPNKIVGHLIELEELLMITETNCMWGSTEDNQENAYVEDLLKLQKLARVQIRVVNAQALSNYITSAEVYTQVPPRFCFLVGDINGVRREENSLSINGIDACGISSNSELNVAILRSLRELNVLDVSNLRGLRYLFTVEILKSLVKLKELCVTSCGEMVELVQGATSTLSLPKLTRLLLFDLPSLKSLCCGQVLHCPELRFIEVWECQKLKFPMINSDHTGWRSLKIHVKGERIWWFGKLEWDDNGIPVLGFGVSPRLHSNFTFSEANVPLDLISRRTTRLQRLDWQAEEANATIQTNNTAFNKIIGSRERPKEEEQGNDPNATTTDPKNIMFHKSLLFFFIFVVLMGLMGRLV